jgi:hypothetical protein
MGGEAPMAHPVKKNELQFFVAPWQAKCISRAGRMLWVRVVII